METIPMISFGISRLRLTLQYNKELSDAIEQSLPNIRYFLILYKIKRNIKMWLILTATIELWVLGNSTLKAQSWRMVILRHHIEVSGMEGRNQRIETESFELNLILIDVMQTTKQ
jgi:hypothetical protein